MTDNLIQKIAVCKNPTAVGLDTSFSYLPELMRDKCGQNVEKACAAIREFNYKIIDAVKDIVPAVKVQVAYYEMYGIAGIKAFADTLAYAKSKGLVVISDVKRNDIGSTAACYSAAYLGQTEINGANISAFGSDYITVNPYLGGDGIEPFLADCKKYNKGIFVLVKTSNPTSGQLQNRVLDDGKTLYETVGGLVEDWGKDDIGQCGYSSVGAVVGATHPKELKELREKMPHTLFLIPGYGAQGGTADDLVHAFDSLGRGGIVNNSRGILCAYKAEKYKGRAYDEAAYLACADMRDDINNALNKAGKSIK